MADKKRDDLLVETLNPDMGYFFRTSKKLYETRTKFQDLEVHELPRHGRMLRRAMKAAQLDEVGLSKASKVDVTMIRKYLSDDPDQWVEIGKKNAPALAKALSLPVTQVLYGIAA